MEHFDDAYKAGYTQEDETQPLEPQEILIVRIVVSSNLSWKELRKNIKAGVDITPGSLFHSISLAREPDPYDLTDPDDPPEGWR